MEDSDGPLDRQMRVMRIRAMDVILDRVVAEAFGVETREVNQAVVRNEKKFEDRHAFQLSQTEFESLVSQGVISKPGRGGSRALPRVFSMKGVARLATVMSSPEALRATDLIIDVFVDVYQQVAGGTTRVTVSDSSRLLRSGHGREFEKLRRKIVAGLDSLLDTVINRKKNTTVREEIEETTAGALEHLKERMKTRGLENDRLTAETMLILEQVRDLRERREVALNHSKAKTEAMALDNLDKKIALVERMLKTLEKIEPSAIATLYGDLSSKELRPVLPRGTFPPGTGKKRDE